MGENSSVVEAYIIVTTCHKTFDIKDKVWEWYYNFSQVGGISQSREEYVPDVKCFMGETQCNSSYDKWANQCFSLLKIKHSINYHDFLWPLSACLVLGAFVRGHLHSGYFFWSSTSVTAGLKNWLTGDLLWSSLYHLVVAAILQSYLVAS